MFLCFSLNGLVKIVLHLVKKIQVGGCDQIRKYYQNEDSYKKRKLLLYYTLL